jgi:DNA-binding NarL/FixJ family response regulator
MGGLPRVRIAVCEEHEIFRRGISASLRDDPAIEVVYEASDGPVPEPVDAVVASPHAVISERFEAAVVVSSRQLPPGESPAPGNRVMAMLPRASLSTSQLVATVRAAAAGLEVKGEHERRSNGLDRRSLEILRLLADGADTHEISESLRFSPRTIKECIYGIERKLGARNRTHAVAEGFRQGLI